MKKLFVGRSLVRFKKFLAERPLVRFALLSFSLPIITLILLVVFAQISKHMPEEIPDLFDSRKLYSEEYSNSLSSLSPLIALLVVLQFYGTTGLIFYGVIVNNKALRQVGIKNIVFLVIGSVLTTLAFFFVHQLLCLSSHDWARFTTVAIFQLSSTSILIAMRYTFWKISMKKFLAERPLVRFRLLSFSLPIITLLLLIAFTEMPEDMLCLPDDGRFRFRGSVLFFLMGLPLYLQFYGITGLILYGGIVNDKAFTQVGTKNVVRLVIGSVLTTLVLFFIGCLVGIALSTEAFSVFCLVSIFHLSSTLILIAIRYVLWKRKQHRAKE